MPRERELAGEFTTEGTSAIAPAPAETDARASVIHDVLAAPTDEGAEWILKEYHAAGLLDDDDVEDLRAERRGD